MIPRAEQLMSVVKPSARRGFGLIYDMLVDDIGCAISARHEYVAFTLGMDMVAAAYPRPDAIDLAIAIPYDPRDKRLFDAMDYKWRSLPTGITITTLASARSCAKYVREAAARVKSGDTLTLSGDHYSRPDGAYDPAFRSFKKRKKR